MAHDVIYDSLCPEIPSIPCSCLLLLVLRFIDDVKQFSIWKPTNSRLYAVDRIYRLNYSWCQNRGVH